MTLFNHMTSKQTVSVQYPFHYKSFPYHQYRHHHPYHLYYQLLAGVVITNDIGGFFLVHSKPNWPNSRSDGAAGFPDTAYSQSLMCVTLNADQFERIASIQMINYPYIYDKYISDNLKSLLPELNRWINKGTCCVLLYTKLTSNLCSYNFILLYIISMNRHRS